MLSRSPGSTGSLARSSFVVLSLALVAGCRHETLERQTPPAPSSEPSVEASSAPAPEAKPVKVYAPSKNDCAPIEVFADGKAAGSICADDADANELTIVDLSDEWTPRVFQPDPVTHDAPEYRAKYLELASSPANGLGLYGIAPTLSIALERLADEKRVACDADVDLAALEAAEHAWSSAPDEKSSAAALKHAATGDALKAAQGELVCAGLLKASATSGLLTQTTLGALDTFRRRNMIVGTGFDGETLHALALGGEELAFIAVLRGLRERVAEAAALVEDGTASETKELVVGRDLDLSRFAPATRGAIDGGAPDLVDTATDAAARALGWTSSDATRAFFAARGKAGVHALKVALKLPARPSYASATMDLRVEIDRGDVFYDFPGQAALAKKKMGVFHGPSFVLYAHDRGRDVPLMRWATTIGGWKKERSEDGEVSLKYKESDVGDRVWRQVIAAPAWLPPDSTPETDLLHEGKDGTVALKRDLIQPGYRNAYGLVMLIHDEPVERDGKTTWADHGIRTHGSVDYRSIQRGESHGCHRLYNQLALRLSGYVLAHRAHARRGKMKAGYHRALEQNGQTIDVDVPNRGYLYEVDPPVPVRVLEGHVMGDSLKPMSTAIPIKTDEPKKG